ncbi:hypothetical protein [Bacillus massiliigorillae]|uniref:hypothetical protein n=1 Tax=Bacillus massiliigorillae TaxID=1243664 RepID=UPI0003A89DFF|nr:hypothetical protein [Bacillus massiliigorillae]
MPFTNCYCDCEECICLSKLKKERYESSGESEIKDESYCEGGVSGAMFNLASPSAATPIVAGTFPTNFPVQKVDFTTCGKYCDTVPDVSGNSIKILRSGIYTISYAVGIAQIFTTPVATSSIIIGVYVNGVFDYSTGITYGIGGTNVTIPTSLNGTYQRPLQAGDMVQIGFYEATFSDPTATAQYGNASLIVKQDFNTDCD